MTDSRQLSRLVESAEDFAIVLQDFRNELPPRDDAAQRNLTDITSAIGELYRLSTILQQLRSAFDAPQYADRLYRIAADAALVVSSAQATLSVALGMVGRASPTTHWMVWDDLSHRLQDVERVSLSMRLRWYYSFTEGLLDLLEGYAFDATLARIKASIQALLQQQQQPESPRAERPVISYRVIESTSTTPRPRITMPMPTSPRPRPRRAVSDYSDTPRSSAPPPVPEVPSPQSPVVTWSSTRTYVSSDDSHSRRTSYSSYDAASGHWASFIFGGDKWRSRYRASSQLEAVTKCKGDVQIDAKLILQEDGFVPLTSVHFSDNGSILTFYWRPQNGRARLLFTSINPWGQEIHYCNPLTRLRAFRDGSILKLCMASSSDDHLFWTWAELKFIYHERMVLFYSTFVALKRQDSAGTGSSLPTALIEDPRDMEEELLFGGTIRDRDMFHALRLLRDRASGVLRLEARPYRGDRDEVPIWTAFLTKYKDNRDRDIFGVEGRGVVSMICPKPKPYIFVPEYGLPLMSDGNFALQFVERDDAAGLVEIWTGLCTSGRRS